MKKPNILLLIAFLLSACAPATTVVPTSASTETSTPAPTATQIPSPTPTIIPSPTQIGGSSGRLIFAYASAEFKNDFPELQGESNVFMANLDGSNQTPITDGLNGNNELAAVSPDGTRAIIHSWNKKISDLYLVDLNDLAAEPVRLVPDATAAKWLDNQRIIYIGQGEQDFGIYT
ncbi:MAG TPA: hypothetical protein VK206_27390, partial [Anaerolineales bacterium]|nr:hypothetical protein [Anaerolineales bacterium]